MHYANEKVSAVDVKRSAILHTYLLHNRSDHQDLRVKKTANTCDVICCNCIVRLGISLEFKEN